MPLSVADLVEINQLYSLYNHAVDDGNGEVFAGCFVADGFLQAGRGPVRGSEELIAFGRRVPQDRPGIRHFISNVCLEGDGDKARGRAYLMLTSAAGGPLRLLSSGRYEDTLQRIDGAWRFAERVFLPDA